MWCCIARRSTNSLSSSTQFHTHFCITLLLLLSLLHSYVHTHIYVGFSNSLWVHCTLAIGTNVFWRCISIRVQTNPTLYHIEENIVTWPNLIYVFMSIYIFVYSHSHFHPWMMDKFKLFVYCKFNDSIPHLQNGNPSYLLALPLPLFLSLSLFTVSLSVKPMNWPIESLKVHFTQ